MSLCRYSRGGVRYLRDSSYVQPLVQNLVRLLNDGTWMDNGSTEVTTVIPNEGLLHLLMTKAIQVPAFEVSGLHFPGGLLDPFSFGSALSASGGGCTPAGTPGVKYCYTQCPPDHTGIGPVCWQICPSGYTDTGAFCDAGSYANGVGYPKLDHYDRGGGRLAHSGLHGFFQCDCGANETEMSPCWCAPVCTADEDASIGSGDRFNICYPKCRPGYTGNLTMCDRWACNPGDFDNGAGLCYPACKPGWSTPTGIVCENIFAKHTTTRGVGYMTTGQCGPNEDSTDVVPDNFLNVCYGGSGYARLDSLTGLGNLRVLNADVTYDGCADKANAKSMTIRLTTLATLNLNASFGFKVCLGIPLVSCDAWPSYDYTQTIPLDFVVDVVLTIPFTSDWLTNMTLQLDQSTLKLENFQTHEFDFVDKIAAVILQVMDVAKGAANAAATVAGWFSDDAKQKIEDRFGSVYNMLHDLLPDLSQKLISAINTGALPLVPSDVVAKYCPIKEFQLLFAGDPCK